MNKTLMAVDSPSEVARVDLIMVVVVIIEAAC